MKGFFKKEWELFKLDMQALGEMVMAPFEGEKQLLIDAPKQVETSKEQREGFFKKEWRLFLEDMQCWGEMMMAPFEKEEKLLLDAPKQLKVEQEVSKKEGFFQKEWDLFKSDIKIANETLENVFGFGNKNNSMEQEMVEPIYIKDEIDYKLETYLGEPINELKENACEDKTQHEVLREYASFFKPYSENPEMCQSAFKKYYDRHALKMAINDFPVEQARIIQNNVDIFIKGQEIFGENGQFVDSRVDTIFEKAGIDKINKVIGILSDTITDGKNMQGERLFAEAVSHMVDNGIKLGKDSNLINPVKKSLETKLEDVHSALRSHDDWNEEYQSLLSQERKYLYALNRIEQFETEERIAEFESKLNELDVVV